MQRGDKIYIPTQEEFEKLGWYLNDTFHHMIHKDRSAVSTRWLGQTMSIENVFNSQVYFYDGLDCLWISRYLIEQWSKEPPHIQSICNCIWNRHPLYCKCKKD